MSSAYNLIMLIALLSLGACIREHRPQVCSKSVHSLAPDVAISIAVEAVHIKNRSDYKIKLSEEEVGYVVYYEAKDKGRIPSFGAVTIDYCGKVLSISRPL